LIVESSKKIGPNAFALPNGSIIVTDQIIEKTEDFEELSAVLLHEVGHIYHNHSMERIITNSILSLIIFVVIGPTDFGSIPLLLMYGNYSRDAELEADRFAGSHLLKQNKDPLLLTKLLKKLKEQNKPDASNLPEFLLSHPHTETREKYLKNLKLNPSGN
jgi:Zn-dependent protease with chaperone function